MDESRGVSVPDASVPDSDAELLNTIRSGGSDAFDSLRARHEAAARSLAGNLEADPAVADDVVARAFARVLEAIRRGGGPTDAFRPYLLTAVRRAALDGGSGESTRIPTDEQQITDPGQLLTDPTAADLADSPVVAAFLALPERWRAVLWHTEIEGATPAEAAPVLGLPAPGVAELADRARDGLAREYLQLQKAAGGGEHADLGDIGAALRSTVAPVILGETATAYLAGLAHPAAAPAGGASAGGASAEGALAGRAAAGRPRSAGPDGSPGGAKPVSAGAAHGPSGGWLNGKLRGSSPQQRTVAGGIAALLVIFAIGGYVLSLRPGAEPQQASGQPTAAGPPSLPAQTSSAPTSSPTAASSPDSPPSSPPSTTGPGTSPTSARPLVTASPSAAPSQAPAPPRSTPPSHPTPPPRHSTPSPSTPAIPVPVPVLPQPTRSPAAQVSAQISVSRPTRFSNVVEVTFGVTDTGPAATGQLTATITLPAGSTLLPGAPLTPGPIPAPDPTLTPDPTPTPDPTLTPGPTLTPSPPPAPGPTSAPGSALLAGPALKLGSTLTAGWNGPGASGWTCSTEGTGAACVHGPIVAAAQTAGILTVMVTGSAACGHPVQVMVTGGAAATSAQSADTIECGPGPAPSTAAQATGASSGHEGTGSRSWGHRPSWGHGRSWGHGHHSGWQLPGTRWPPAHWPNPTWPSPK